MYKGIEEIRTSVAFAAQSSSIRIKKSAGANITLGY